MPGLTAVAGRIRVGNQAAAMVASIDSEGSSMGSAVADPPQAAEENTTNGAVPQVEELRVDGTAQLGMFDSGGKKPQTASIRLSGGRILLLDGKAFRKGDVLHFSGTAVVREVAQRDKPDPKTGIVVSAEQKHVAQITDLVVSGANEI